MNGVVFDCDGVLADSESISWRVWAGALEQYGITVTPEDVAACTGTTVRDTYAHFARMRPLPPFEEFVPAVDELELSRYRAELRPFPDAFEAVQALAMLGVPLAVASSSSRHALDFKLELLGLDRYFDFTVAGDEVENGKPEPDLYRVAVEALGIDPAISVAVEDTTIGADAAAAAGLRVVIVDRIGLASGRHPTVSEIDSDLLLLWLGRA